MLDFLVICFVLIVLTSIAAVIDHRTGTIPNYMTYTTAIAAIVAHSVYRWPTGFFESAMGALLSFAVPYLAFRARAMGGGDVKLFTAIGAIGGPSIGLEVELLSLATIYLYGIFVVTKRGTLKQTLSNSWCVAINAFLPTSRRVDVQAETLTSFRLGGAILIGTLVCIADRLWLNGLML